jgi:toxin ParE1/3/4
MRIRWEEEALTDLVALRNYIAAENPSAARKVAQRIVDIVNLLIDQPLLGGPGRIHNTRELVITNTPYTIIYHAAENIVTILRVFHQARKWPHDL